MLSLMETTVIISILQPKSNNMITIDITNYGQPIPSTDLPHIFERFIAISLYEHWWIFSD